MKKVRIDKKSFKFPESWAEVSEKQALLFVWYIYQGSYHNNSIGDYSNKFKAHMVRMLMPVENELFYRLYASDFLALMDLCRFFFETPCLHPVIKRLPGGLYLPAPKLNDSTFQEFIFADEFFMKVCQGDNVEDNLNKLVGVLCRPKRQFWWFKKRYSNESDIRRDFSDADLVNPLINRIPVHYKNWVFFFYYNFRRFIMDKYPSIFNNQGGDNESNFGWIGILNDLSETGTFGNYDQTCKALVHNVLFTLAYNQAKHQQQSSKLS